MKQRLVRIASFAAALAAAAGGIAFGIARADVAPHVAADDPVTAGRYLINYGGCNDCHTAGQMEGQPLPGEAQRLTGSRLGFMGPWGVSYPANLRLVFASMTPQQWDALIANPGPYGKPPMPWASLQQLSEGDRQAIYAYVRSLGPAGSPAPADVAPGQTPQTPYIVMMPQGPGAPQPPH